VLIGREGAGESSLRILVPVDGSDGSLHALDQVARVSDLAGAEVTLVHVVENHWLRPVDDPDWAAGEDEAHPVEPLLC
jgi:nucleotide-binding universal stress UspA family protein